MNLAWMDWTLPTAIFFLSIFLPDRHDPMANPLALHRTPRFSAVIDHARRSALYWDYHSSFYPPCLARIHPFESLDRVSDCGGLDHCGHGFRMNRTKGLCCSAVTAFTP